MSTRTMNKPLSSNKGTQRRIRLLSIAIISLVFWAVVTVWDQTGKFNEQSRKMDALMQKLSETQKMNEETKKQIARLDDPEAKEEKVRKELHYAKPGETVFDIPSKP